MFDTRVSTVCACLSSLQGAGDKKSNAKGKKADSQAATLERNSNRDSKSEAQRRKEDGQATTPERESKIAKKQPKPKRGGAFTTRKPEGGGAGGLPVHYIALPALLLGGVAILVYFGEQWLLGPAVNRPLPLTPAVSSQWRNESEYGSRVWGTYRWAWAVGGGGETRPLGGVWQPSGHLY